MFRMLFREARHPLTSFLAAVCVACAGMFSSIPSYSQTVHLQPPTQISAPRDGAHFWTQISADPSSPGKLIVCGHRWSARLNTIAGALYSSMDGGQSWQNSLTDSSDEWVSEITCAYGEQGEAYFIAQPSQRSKSAERMALRALGNKEKQPDAAFKATYLASRHARLHLYSSIDYGLTWSAPRTLDFLDATRVAVDQTRGRDRGRLYVFANGSPGVELISSADRGESFARASQPDALTKTRYGFGFPGDVVVLPSGTVLAAYATRRLLPGTTYVAPGDSPFATEIMATRDGGRTLSLPVLVASTRNPGCASTFPSLAVDVGSARYQGRAYLLWSDQVNGECHMLLSSSDDDGVTWAEPKALKFATEQLGPKSSGYVTSLAVNKYGVVGVSWTSHSDDGNTCWYFSASLDGGETFSPLAPISRCVSPIFPRRTFPSYYISAFDSAYDFKGADAGASIQVLYSQFGSSAGGHAGMTTDSEGAFHPIWTEGRDGGGSLWTTTILVDTTSDRGEKSAVGGPSLSGLQDVSRCVELILQNHSYDEATHTLASDVRIRNNGSEVLLPPLFVRVENLESSWGLAKESRGGVRSLFDFGVAIGDGLGPGEVSKPKRVEFQVTNLIGDKPLTLQVTLRAFSGTGCNEEKDQRGTKRK